MAKQQMYQQFIFKLHSSRILKAPDKNLKISIQEARDNREIISLADGQILQMIDEINSLDRKFTADRIKEIKREIKLLKKQSKSRNTSVQIKKCYQDLDNIQCKLDYVAIIMNNKEDIFKLSYGFRINGTYYNRLIGTTNGIKKNTVIYAAAKNSQHIKLCEELTRRMNNGRNLNKELVPAKFEAYKALTCSASVPVTHPKDILVVDDLIVTCKEKVIKITDEFDGEPVLTEPDNPEIIEVNDSDGYGLITPTLSETWAKDVLEDYIPSGYCIRNSFCKGMVFTFDFHKFAYEYGTFNENGDCIVIDVWGNKHNIKNVDLILTTSMLKLWDSYDSIDSYLENCKKNGYGFRVTKVCPEKLENERNMNYQFLQSYELTDEEIQELIAPTVNEIKDVIHGDIDKTILFLNGATSDEDFSLNEIDNVTKSVMIEPSMANDPFVINRINYMIKKKITQAKIGVLKVHGNYAVISGDPFALCQKIFGVNVENNDYGLLKAGQMYSKYWSDYGSDRVVCFRAPMSCHNNIRVMNVTVNKMMSEWYKYMTTVNIVNCHDSMAAALNGFDKDGDCLITTDNPILLRNTRPAKTIMCVQKKANKEIICESNLMQANYNSFGEEIGKVTNRITAMYDVQVKYPKESKEYKILDYRIMCGQLVQQNTIDKAKGIISKPMPEAWYNRFALNYNENDSDEERVAKEFNKTIIADKKPYFMCYIYPQEMSKYKNYIENNNAQCINLFGMTISELEGLKDKTEDQLKYLDWYYKKMPVSVNDCTMNRICRAVELAFENYNTEVKSSARFNYKVMQCRQNDKHPDYPKLKKMYENYTRDITQYMVLSKKQRFDKEQIDNDKMIMTENYRKLCSEICTDEFVLCDILLDICYKTEKSKKFVWDICGDTIIENLLRLNDWQMSYYVPDETGDIEYGGTKYKKATRKVGV